MFQVSNQNVPSNDRRCNMLEIGVADGTEANLRNPDSATLEEALC